jgi:cyclopropane fatty-acyl-phospholipid synthase-like methyltransferase
MSYDGSEVLGYVATDWRVIRTLFRVNALSPDDVLLDYGCGKGRVALWVASKFPVRRVIGVDLDPELVAVARANLARWARPLRCRDVAFECVDARDFDVPDDVTVVYMFNPFMGEVFAQVVAKIQESLGRRPRSFRVIYFYPIMHNALVDDGFEVEHFHRELFYAWATYQIG